METCADEFQTSYCFILATLDQALSPRFRQPLSCDWVLSIFLSTLTVVNVSRNGRGALYNPLKLLTLKTRKIHLNRPFKVLHSHHLLTDMR